MKRAILPLLLIIAMALSVSVATADSFTGSGGITDANGWSPSGNWINGLGDTSGLTTDGTASATHAVTTGADGVFTYDVQVRINDASNKVSVGLATDGSSGVTISYHGGDSNHVGHFWMNNEDLGPITVGLTDDPHIVISSTDGQNWHYDVDVYNGDVAVGAVPSSISIGLTDNAGDNSPMISTLSYTSPGAPAVTTMPAVTSDMDVAQVQSYYDNIYPLLYGPQANFLSTSTAPTSFKVSGIVTGAADNSPIAGASIVLGDAKQTTDNLGAFKFDGITAGNVDIAVSADGFASQTVTKNVNADLTLNFALAKVATGGSTVASAANDSANVTMPANATMVPTTAPAPTQTKSPGFEGIIAAIAMIGAAGALVYLNKKH
jgi:hypothetical protein